MKKVTRFNTNIYNGNIFSFKFSHLHLPKHTGVLRFSKWASTFQKREFWIDLDGPSIFKGTGEK
jgi:hypothetical protein